LIVDWLRQIASTEVDFGSHTWFDQGLVAVTATVKLLTVTPTASNLRSRRCRSAVEPTNTIAMASDYRRTMRTWIPA
jgi:hypothetical protein